MPKYRGVVKVYLREDMEVTAFDKEQAKDYFWAKIGDEGENLDLDLMDWSDIDINVYEI